MFGSGVSRQLFQNKDEGNTGNCLQDVARAALQTVDRFQGVKPNSFYAPEGNADLFFPLKKHSGLNNALRGFSELMSGRFIIFYEVTGMAGPHGNRPISWCCFE